MLFVFNFIQHGSIDSLIHTNSTIELKWNKNQPNIVIKLHFSIETYLFHIKSVEINFKMLKFEDLTNN